MAKNLVIVESPAKARTVGRYLGSDYVVLASLGHVRDLPQRTLGVDVERGFEPEYEVTKDKERGGEGDSVEGEGRDQRLPGHRPRPRGRGDSLASCALGGPGPQEHQASWCSTRSRKRRFARRSTARVTSTRTWSTPSRRGAFSTGWWATSSAPCCGRRSFTTTPAPSLSPRAGCSRSRCGLVADRDGAIAAFVPKEYWTIEARLRGGSGAGGVFTASFHSVAGEKSRLEIPAEAEAMGLVADLRGASYSVAQVRKRQVKQRPAAPFTTSSLQQEAWRKLRFSARRTMAIAQQLYEGLPIGEEGSVGLITYMRTDSTSVRIVRAPGGRWPTCASDTAQTTRPSRQGHTQPGARARRRRTRPSGQPPFGGIQSRWPESRWPCPGSR